MLSMCIILRHGNIQLIGVSIMAIFVSHPLLVFVLI